MPKEILVNSNADEVRVAVLDGGNISELFIERISKKSAAGNIYKGKVVKVLPGMQSAFVEVGLQKAAFLHVADIYMENSDRVPYIDDDAESQEDEESRSKRNEIQKVSTPIEELITEGQEIIVQVAKDAIATKGARLTTHLTIPGRYLVLMPGYEHIGISRKIEDEAERERLRDVLCEIKPEGMGLIARTVSGGMSKEDLEMDLQYLIRIWNNVNSSMDEASAPALIYEDHDLIFKILRDITSKDVTKIIIDNQSDFSRMQIFLKDYLSGLSVDLELYCSDVPLFDLYNVEIEINRLLDKKVWLRSGGSIIIDQAEALTVIDVNTGKYVGKRNFDDTILKTNLEACSEIAHQLKIRNIGGIIIVDFIDMERPEDKEKVLTTLEQYLKEDRAKASVVNISPLGLVEITRKRVQESVARMMSEPCPYCDGRGVIKSRITVCYEIMRHIRRLSPDNRGKTIIVDAHPDVADLLLNHESEAIDELERTYGVVIRIQSDSEYNHDHYMLTPTRYV